MIGLATIKAKIAAGLLMVLGVLIAALRLIAVGKNAQKAETLKKQRTVEREVKEAQKHEHEKSISDLNKARAARDRGDFSHFNDD